MVSHEPHNAISVWLSKVYTGTCMFCYRKSTSKRFACSSTNAGAGHAAQVVTSFCTATTTTRAATVLTIRTSTVIPCRHGLPTRCTWKWETASHNQRRLVCEYRATYLHASPHETTFLGHCLYVLIWYIMSNYRQAPNYRITTNTDNPQ